MLIYILTAILICIAMFLAGFFFALSILHKMHIDRENNLEKKRRTLETAINFLKFKIGSE